MKSSQPKSEPKQPQPGLDATWTVDLVGPRNERIRGRVVRSHEGLVTVVIGVGQSLGWKSGDEIELSTPSPTQGSGDASPRVGRIYSTYKTFGADHVVIDMVDTVEPRRPQVAKPDNDQRNSVRVRPDAKNPILALFLVGERILEGRARNASVDGIGLYVAGRNGCEADVGNAGTLVFCLPGATKDCRFHATVVRRESMVHGIVYGLKLEPAESIESLRQQQDMLRYVQQRSEERTLLGKQRP